MNRLYKIAINIILLVVSFAVTSAASDLTWENISGNISKVNFVLMDRKDHQRIYIATSRGVFKSSDNGDNWKRISGLSCNVNFLSQDDQGVIYAATTKGLFINCNQEKNWKRIFQGRIYEENNCQRILIARNNVIFLGTQAGLFISQDNATTWHKPDGKLANLPIVSMAEDRLNDIVYIATGNKVFKSKDMIKSYQSIFTASTLVEEGATEEDLAKIESDYLSNNKIKDLVLGQNEPVCLYLATVSGLLMSQNQGLNWQLLPGSTQFGSDIRCMLLTSNSELYTVDKYEVSEFKDKNWQRLSSRLPCADVRFFTKDNQGIFYLATGKGLFRGLRNENISHIMYLKDNFEGEPKIRELHLAAIKYAQVIDPRRIENLRKQAKIKAILPELSLDYDKTVTSYSNSSCTRFEVGPQDWGVSLKWDLGDLIWSEQQRLIDSQVRLMVILRNDILDEVNKLYFERRRIKNELSYLSCEESKKTAEKKLKLEELTASLDALTGGYFSLHLND